MKRTADEIAELCAEATAIVEDGRIATRRAKLAQETVDALFVVIEKLTEERAFEHGVTPDDLSLDDVLVTDDDRALMRQVMRASVVANDRRVADDDNVDRVIARLAIERGWTLYDAARAILRDARAKADAVRDSSQKALASRVRRAVRQAAAEQLRRIDQQIAAIDGVGPASSAAPILLVFALICAITGTPFDRATLRAALVAERDRLGCKLS